MSRAHSDNDAGDESPNPVQVQKFLGGIDYPAGRQQIIDVARRQGASDEVIGALERIPDRRYDSPVAVSRELGKLT